MRSLALHNETKKFSAGSPSSAAFVLVLGEMRHGGQAWVISDKNYSLSMMTQMNVISASESWIEWHDFDFVLTPSDPLHAVPSTTWFAILHQQWSSRVLDVVAAGDGRRVVTVDDDTPLRDLVTCLFDSFTVKLT